MGSGPAPRPETCVRYLRTADVEDLASAQPEKNRRYIQLQPGRTEAELVEARLGQVQIFRERVGAGMFVEAAPAANLVPFAILLSSAGEIRFCGSDLRATNFAQAAGGGWDVRFDGPLDYVSWVFERAHFERAARALRADPPPDEWFRSRVRPAAARAVGSLGATIARTLDHLRHQPSFLEQDRVRREIESELLRRTVAVLSPADGAPAAVAGFGRRQLGVRRVIEYLTDQPDPDTTLPTLCAVAGVSERTLEYGFRERLGVTPIRFLRLLRLNRARRDLLHASQPGITVTDVAMRWGFVELGRFAGEYRRLFGELPSETLRSRRPRPSTVA